MSDRFADEPALEGEIRCLLAETYLDLGLYDEAQAQAQLALEVFPEQHERVFRTRITHAHAARRAGQLERSLELAREVFEDAQREFGPDHGLTLLAMSQAGDALQMLGRHDEGYPLLEQAAAGLALVFGPNDDRTVGAMTSMVGSLIARGLDEEARELNAEVLERTAAAHGPEDASTLSVQYNQLTLILRQQDFDAAAELGAELWGSVHEAFPPDHYMIGYVALSYGMSLARAGEPERGAPLLLEAFEFFERVEWKNSYSCEATTDSLIGTYGLLGDNEQVEYWRCRALQIRLCVGRGGELDTAVRKFVALEEHLRGQGLEERAAGVAERLVHEAEAYVARGDHHRVRYFTNLGEVLRKLDRPVEAEAVLQRALEEMDFVDDADVEEEHSRIASGLVEVYTTLGDEEEANRWAEELEGGE